MVLLASLPIVLRMRTRGESMLPTDLNPYAEAFQQQGYVVVPHLFTQNQVDRYIDHYMALRAQGEKPGDYVGVNSQSNDPWKKYPRMIHMHRWDEISLQWLLDEELNRCMTAFLGQSPYAVQTMLYFKPPG